MFYAKFIFKIWEFGAFLLGKLAHFHLGIWRIFTWEFGAFSLGNLAQNPNMFYPPNLSNSSL